MKHAFSRIAVVLIHLLSVLGKYVAKLILPRGSQDIGCEEPGKLNTIAPEENEDEN